MALPRALRPPVAWVSRTRIFRAIGPRILPPLERMWKVVSRGYMPFSGLGVPSLVLHTTGAKTGTPRDVPLMYCPDGDDMLVTGSNFARDAHPAWTVNLLQHPDAAVSIHGRRLPVRAALVPAAQREAVWTKLEENWPGYREYERSAGRELRIFRLTPR